MRFHQHFTSSRPTSEGYRAETTEGINSDLAIFQIGRSGNENLNILNCAPQEIKMRADLKAVPREEEKVFAVWQRGQNICTPFDVYSKINEESQYGQQQAVQIIAKEFYNEAQKNPIIEENFLLSIKELLPLAFTFSFATQLSGICQLEQNLDPQGRCITSPPGKENGYPLWAYGGHYKPGCDLKQIEQIFFTPTQGKLQTALHFTVASKWVSKNITINTVHNHPTIAFMDSLDKHHFMNLMGFIEQGGANFEINIGTDENGCQYKHQYSSFAIHQADKSIESVDIYFRKKE